ncbi:ABC-2 family transporter [Chitinophaga dinghuensis]|uniref:ABC-2 family transporter n=1 Tax=Chitinophaga dinghuensis TaxID=1539050 RepID=A0A327VMA7_9BACT|nr:ABC transporter permease [Chitinophaga dinghuensis]RAJ74010.1 ABC-2 family transporter [Chitinophaga dinghuensis]
MKQIILAEWLKLKYYRTFWVILILSVIIPIAGNYTVAEIFSSKDLKQAQFLLGGPFSFPDVWQTVACVSSFVSGLYGILLIVIVTNEYNFRTNRQNIIDGWERKDFVFAKLFWVMKLAVLSLVVVAIVGALLGMAYGSKSFTFEGFNFVFYYFLQVVVQLIIALLIAVFVSRPGLSIVIYFAYNMMIEQTLVTILKRSVGAIGGLLPLQAGDELLPFPGTKMLAQSMPGGTTTYDTYVYLIAMVVYITLGIWLVFRKVTRTDL